MKKRLAILSTLAVAFGLALAATPAGTTIQNQASARYIDSANQPRTTTSNEVITVVQQVYGFTITPNGTEAAPGQTRSALPGAQVYFAYTVTNNSNGTDTINLSTAQGAEGGSGFDLTSITLIRDDNCDGTVDPGEPTLAGSVTLAQDASVCVIVAATIPSGTANGLEADINLSGTSAGDTVAPLTTDTDNWATAYATTAAALDINKSASPTGQVSGNATITYTLSGQNRGGSAAYEVNDVITIDSVARDGILITDTIPTGLSYVASSLSASAGAGTVVRIYSTNAGSTWTATQPASGVNAVGILIEETTAGVVAFFPQTAQYSMSFQAAVPASPAAGTTYLNFGTLRFSGDNDGNATDPGETSNSNTTTNWVGGSNAVAIGGTGPTAVDGADTQTIASATSGSTVTFNNTLQNNGNTNDSFTLSLGTSTIGTCLVYQSDGSTPLSGAVGPLAPAGTYNVIVKCAIPANQTTGGNVTLTATSVTNPSGTVGTLADGVDATTLAVTTVSSGYGVDAGSISGANATTDTPGVAAINAGGETANDILTNPAAINPNTTVNIPFAVQNAGSSSDTYNFTSNLPSGWSVLFYPDSDCNGVANSGAAPIANTGLVAASGSDKFCAVAGVQIPAGNAPGTNTISLTATSTTLSTVTDTVQTTVTVNTVTSFQFNPDRGGTVTSPGTITYTHNLVNNGNAVCTVSIPVFSSAYSWVYQFSTDGGNNWTTSVAGFSLPANTTSGLQVRVIVPGGQPIGRTEAAGITATCDYGSGLAPTATITDSTTVVGGDLRLTKSVDKATALPGENLVYTVLAENIGTANLTQVVVSDPLPAYTNFFSLAVTKSYTGDVLVSDDGTAWQTFDAVDTSNDNIISAAEWTTAFGAMSAGGVVYVGVSNDAATPDTNITAADTMVPAASITITFTVTVQ